MAVPRILVSYYFASTANRDYQAAMQLAADLRARGANVIAEEATVPDEQVNAYLNQELPRCQWFILILTPEAVSSPRVRWEVDTALNMYRQGRMMGLLALWLVPANPNAIPPTWRSVLHSCDASQNYRDGLFQVLQIIELPQHDPSSPPAPNQGEESDTLVPRREDSQNTEWAGPTQRHSQDIPGTDPTPRQNQDIPTQRYSQNFPGAGPTPRYSDDIPTQRQSQDFPGADPFHGYDQNEPNPAFFQPKNAPFASGVSSLKTPPRQWLILIAVVLVVLLAVGFLIPIVGHLGGSPSATSADASKNATATATAAVANANATAIAMASTPQGLYTLVMQRQPTLSDPLRAQDNNQWDVNSSQAGGCAFTGGAYHASITVAGEHTACMSRKAAFKNFAYQVQMTLLNGDAGGLIFRSDNAVSTFYRFAIDSTGAYRLFSCKGCTGNQNGGNALAFGDIGVKANQPNTLTVIAINNTLDLYVNGQFVKSVNDATSDAGELGVYAGTFVQAFMHPTEVAFSNVKVWAL